MERLGDFKVYAVGEYLNEDQIEAHISYLQAKGHHTEADIIRGLLEQLHSLDITIGYELGHNDCRI